MSTINESLTHLFEKHRVVFWYDEREELREEFEALTLPGVERIEVRNDEFFLKYRLARQSSEGKFLLYRPTPRPTATQNWLLDLELAHYEFHTSQEATYLQELGLDYAYKGLVGEHLEFFKSKERRQKLATLLAPDDTHADLRRKMLAVTFGIGHVSLPAFVQAHAAAFAADSDRPERELERYHLGEFYWGLIATTYKYHAAQPGLYDFLLEVFSNVFSLTKSTGLTKDASLLLSVWKDSIAYRDAFHTISARIATDLDVESLLDAGPLDDLLNDDLFRLIDFKIIRDLTGRIVAGNADARKVGQWIKRRENKYWYAEFADYYAALGHATELLGLVQKYVPAPFPTIEEGVQRYGDQLYRADFHYRKFIWHYRNTAQNNELALLFGKVEKVYSNDWLLPLNNQWQATIDATDAWPILPRTSQARFYRHQVEPVLAKGQRLFVVVSDALRYECGAEFVQRVNAENRYEGELVPLLSVLPSYTQLGMAALLPHQSLSIAAGSDKVLADGIPALGLQGRNRVLEALADYQAIGIQAEDFMKMNSATEGRAFVKQYDLIYIFHNQIDKVGDDKTTEDDVFAAVDRELDYLLEVIKRIANMNGTNVFITADHGFIYQHQPLDESDFAVIQVEGDIWKENRRYLIGKDLKTSASTRHFTAQALNLDGDFDVLLPKSINRHRVKGAGSRFVHGGASLQEVVIPLIKVTKKRQNTTRQVAVDLIQQTNKITTNLLSVSFLQTELATDSVLPRTIRAAFYADDGEQLSDQFNFIFDIEEGSERQREVKHPFQLSSKASGPYKNQRVTLRLEEPVEGSSKWRTYKEYIYTLNISFSSDFDNF